MVEESGLVIGKNFPMGTLRRQGSFLSVVDKNECFVNTTIEHQLCARHWVRLW